jgi:hypothetical protein
MSNSAALKSTFARDCGGQIPAVRTLTVAISDHLSVLSFPGDESNPVPVAGLSWRGPAHTRLKKADFVLPGKPLQRAYSHGVNQKPDDRVDTALSTMHSSGTSMAAALASGALSLVL